MRRTETGNPVAEIFHCVENETCGKSLKLALLRGETLRAPMTSRSLSVVSGVAWVTDGGVDLLLREGERVSLARRRSDPAVISAVGEQGLFFELQ